MLVKKAYFIRLISLSLFKSVLSGLAQFCNCVHKCFPHLKQIVTGMLSNLGGARGGGTAVKPPFSLFYIPRAAIVCLCRTVQRTLSVGRLLGIMLILVLDYC